MTRKNGNGRLAGEDQSKRMMASVSDGIEDIKRRKYFCIGTRLVARFRQEISVLFITIIWSLGEMKYAAAGYFGCEA